VITQTELKNLCKAAALAGFNVDVNTLSLETWEAGDRHRPTRLPNGKAAVYVFVANGECLKVGKVNCKSGARYTSQHYSPKSSRSNLARSLMGDEGFRSIIGSADCREWIRKNTTRYNILIPVELGEPFLHFAEAFMILKLLPKFEAG
jgi:hypothetical protein